MTYEETDKVGEVAEEDKPVEKPEYVVFEDKKTYDEAVAACYDAGMILAKF